MSLSSIKLPTWREANVFAAVQFFWIAVTALFLELRPEHWLMLVLMSAMFFLTQPSRKLLVALVPFALFGISYDWMNLCHNYEVNTVDIEGIYNAEKSLFGIATAAGILTPNEFFAQFDSAVVDFLCGLFYLCWVPVPIAFGLWLYFRKQRAVYLHFAIVFLLVNLIGFTFYYIHPAAPPWYYAKYGAEFLTTVPGDVAGLGGFDDMTGLGIFNGLYARNSNIFAAVPSLHSAYVPVALFYSFKAKCPGWMRVTLAVIACGIWFTAVYTSHHYVIDVLLGIACAAVGIALFECVLMRIPAIKRFVERYIKYISL